jgi:hypothetical protein
VAPRRSGAATGALILGLLGLVACFTIVPSVVAIVLGVVAARSIRASGGTLTGLGAARAGWITGVVGAVAGVAFVGAALTGAFDDDEVAVVDLEVGQCLRLEVGEGVTELSAVTVVDCEDPHEAEVVHVGELNPEGDRAYPSDEELFAEIDGICTIDRFLAYAGGEPREAWASYPVAPDEGTWERLDGRFVCLALSPDGPRTGSLRVG